MKKTLAFLFLPFGHASFCQQCPDISKLKKVALVIGNSKYDYANPLANPVNDANDMRDVLVKLDFKVFRYIDADLQTMTAAIDDWNSKTDSFDVALFYYAGHGCQSNGIDYLFASDSHPLRPPDLKFRTYPLNSILDNMAVSKAKIKIAMIDACRNNPFTRSWTRDIGGSQGLVSAGANGTLVSFSAGPNETSEDGAGRNGTYTAAVLRYIETANESIYDFFTNINNSVITESKGAQHPFITANLTSPFCFVTTTATPTSSTESTIGNKVKSLLNRIQFNTSLAGVLAFEFGEVSRNQFTYESLPIATECTNSVIRYYWRYLKDSKLKSRIMVFLNQAGLWEEITPDAYVVYIFKDNRLMRIDLRLYSDSENFYSDVMNAFSLLPNFAPIKYKSRLGEDYVFISSFKEAGWNSVSISYSSIEGFNACNNDWWTK